MKVLVESHDEEGLIAFLGKKITIFCGVYIYTGTLVGVNDSCVKLSDAMMVFSTGKFSDKAWSDAEAFPGDFYVQMTAIESFGVLK
jgi:hypothetical protein